MAVCMSARNAKHRGCAIEEELYAEYGRLFRPVTLREPRWARPLEQCAESAVNVALSTRIPIFCETVKDLLCNLHPVQLVVFTVFLEHLEKTWYGIQNPILHDMRRHVNLLVSTMRKDRPGMQSREAERKIPSSTDADDKDFGDVFDCWDFSVRLETHFDAFDYWRLSWRL